MDFNDQGIAIATAKKKQRTDILTSLLVYIAVVNYHFSLLQTVASTAAYMRFYVWLLAMHLRLSRKSTSGYRPRRGYRNFITVTLHWSSI